MPWCDGRWFRSYPKSWTPGGLQADRGQDWVAWLDFDTLEKVSGSYVSDDLRDREDDIIWRIRMGADEGAAADAGGQGEWLYVYLLLKFQSNSDPYMAVRILHWFAVPRSHQKRASQIDIREPRERSAPICPPARRLSAGAVQR